MFFSVCGDLQVGLQIFCPNASPKDIAKGRGQTAEGRREKLDGSWFQYLARVLIALATATIHVLPNLSTSLTGLAL